MQVRHSLTGYVRIKISGPMPERLVNLCLVHNILLRDIVWREDAIEAFIGVQDFHRLRPLVRRARVRVRILERHGLAFHLEKLRRRPLVVLLTLLCLICLYGLSQFVWFVDVSGPLEHLAAEDITAAAAELGLKPGVLRPAIDGPELARQLVLRQPVMAWAHISFRGVRATIEVVEKVLPPETPDQGPGDVVARRTGIIEEILVLSGEARVEAGDTVAAGDVLISGLLMAPAPQEQMPVPGAEEPPPERFAWLQARGQVLARTWYEAYEEVQLEQELTVNTGREAVKYRLQVGAHELPLSSGGQAPFTHYETERTRRPLDGGILERLGGGTFPLAVLTDTYYEQQIHRHEIDLPQAEKEARRLLQQKVLQEVPAHAQIVNMTAETVQKGANFVGVRLQVECLEDIGQFQLRQQPADWPDLVPEDD